MASIISHRGNDNHNNKENTIKAITESLKREYIDGVEFDIRMTKDKKFILHHSPIIYNLGLICNNKYKDIIKYNIDELNNTLKSLNTNKIILIDIKCEICNYNIYIKNLHKILKKYKNLNIYLCSFNYNLVKEIKEKYNYKVGLIISNVINRNKEYNLFDFVLLNYRVKEKINKTLMLWTINKKQIINKYLNKDLYIITDKPYLIENKY